MSSDIAAGQLDLNNPKASEKYFWSQAKTFKTFTYIGYGLSNGSEVGAGRWIQGLNLLIYHNPGLNKGKAADYLADEQGNRPPSLILLDVMMPGIDGFETCQRLKADPVTKDIRVIFITALSDTEIKVKGLSVGGVD